MASDTNEKGRTPHNPLEKLGKDGQKVLHDQDASAPEPDAGIASDLQPNDPAAEAEEQLFSDASKRVISNTQHRISGDGGNHGRTTGPNSEAIPNSQEERPANNNPSRNRGP